MSKFLVFLWKTPVRNILLPRSYCSACVNYAAVKNLRNPDVFNLRFQQPQLFTSTPNISFSTTSSVRGGKKEGDGDDDCFRKPLQKGGKKRKKSKGGQEDPVSQCRQKRLEDRKTKKSKGKQAEECQEECKEDFGQAVREKCHAKQELKKDAKKGKSKEAEECQEVCEEDEGRVDFGQAAREKCRAKQELKQDAGCKEEAGKKKPKMRVLKKDKMDRRGMNKKKRLQGSTACKPRVKRYRDPYGKPGWFAKFCSPKQCETMVKYILGGVIFGLASTLLMFYFTDWNPFKGEEGEEGGKKEKKKCKRKSASSRTPAIAVAEGEQNHEEQIEGRKAIIKEDLGVECICKDRGEGEEEEK